MFCTPNIFIDYLGLEILGNHLEDSACEVIGANLKVNVGTKFFILMQW